MPHGLATNGTLVYPETFRPTAQYATLLFIGNNALRPYRAARRADLRHISLPILTQVFSFTSKLATYLYGQSDRSHDDAPPPRFSRVTRATRHGRKHDQRAASPAYSMVPAVASGALRCLIAPSGAAPQEPRCPYGLGSGLVIQFTSSRSWHGSTTHPYARVRLYTRKDSIGSVNAYSNERVSHKRTWISQKRKGIGVTEPGAPGSDAGGYRVYAR